jgi:membrane-associated phospholipid phosphatase
MRQDLLVKITGLGDPTLLLLGGLGLFFYLWTDDERRVLARSWAVAFGLCLFLTIFSKFTFHLWGNQTNFFRIHSPSGHVAIATSSFGCWAMMLAAGRSQAARVLIFVGTALLLGMIAASRIMLGLHNIPEVAFAFAIGAFSLVVFGIYLGNREPIALSAGQVIALLLLLDVTHYAHVDAEALIGQLVHKIDSLGDEGANGVVGRTSSPTAQFDPQLDRYIHRQSSILERSP